MSHLLIQDYPLLVLPKLACRVGVSEALFLQQLFWLEQGSKNIRDDKRWVYNTYEGWTDVFPFWNATQIKRIVTKLEELGVLVSTNRYNKMPMDKTKWYRIKHDSPILDFSENSNEINDETKMSDDETKMSEQYQETFIKDFQQRNTTTTECAPECVEVDSVVDDNESFAMHKAWEVRDVELVNGLLHRAKLPSLDSEMMMDAMLDFVAHWLGVDTQRTAQEWDLAFVKSAVAFKTKRVHVYEKTPTVAQGQSAGLSKTEQKVAWLRQSAQDRANGLTTGKLNASVFGALCEGLAVALETGASKGAPLLDGMGANVSALEKGLAVQIGADEDGVRLADAFDALIGSSDVYPTLEVILRALPARELPKYRANIAPVAVEKTEKGRGMGKKILADMTRKAQQQRYGGA